MARANMLHATLHWPHWSFVDLWSLAMTYAVWVYNKLPRSGVGLSPEELFSGVKVLALDCLVLMSSGVPYMFLTLAFKTVRRFQKGTVELGREFLLDSLPTTPVWSLWCLTPAPNTFLHNFMSSLMMFSPLSLLK
eukprot:CCRYP_006639-RC/>CCRYP_006639-RC protein AED:0.44 eAED:0.33 QI:0/-1/0/1/-1/1/1/0/134